VGGVGFAIMELGALRPLSREEIRRFYRSHGYRTNGEAPEPPVQCLWIVR